MGAMRSRLPLLIVVAGAGALLSIAAPLRAAPAVDCAAEVAKLTKDETELPRLEVANPLDRPPYCITLETIMDFAVRLKAHVGRCPTSTYAPAVPQWEKTRADYAKLFAQYRCRRTF
jgi:hypothetical protein